MVTMAMFTTTMTMMVVMVLLLIMVIGMIGMMMMIIGQNRLSHEWVRPEKLIGSKIGKFDGVLVQAC